MNDESGRIEALQSAEVAGLLKRGEVLLIDVREPAEYAAERIPGALLYPLSTFDPLTLPADGARRVVFHCGSGKRFTTAAENVWRRGALTPRTWREVSPNGKPAGCPSSRQGRFREHLFRMPA